MPLSISLGSARLRPVALGGSNARIMERICSQEMVWNFPDGFQCRVAARSQPPVRMRPILT